MGTHPNTHCCHAVLDVLFICWIPAQSRSHAFPRALSLPPNTLPPFLPPKNAPVTQPHALQSRWPPLCACRVLGSAPFPCRLFLSLDVFPGLFPLSFPLLLHAFPPARLCSLIADYSSTFLSYFSGFLPLFSFPVPLRSLLSPAFRRDQHPVFAPKH